MTDYYTGVYSDIEAGTDIGTKISKSTQGNVLTSSTPASKGRQYQAISAATLEGADLNVAKIRIVSTLPGKEVADEVKGKAYVGFILTGVQETHNEKVEIVPLPGDNFASYFYGANPRQYAFSGILLNTEQDQWRDSFETLYERYLRGSVSSRDLSIVQVSYNGRIVSGWLLGMTQQLDSSNDHYASFSFNVLVSRVDMIGGSKNFTDYLVSTSGDDEFSRSRIDSDYAVLDTTNYNGMIDPIRTGMVIPPKRPHRSRKKSKSPSCYFPAQLSDKGTPINNGAATANSHINDATVCTVTSLIIGSQKRIKEARSKAEELAIKARDAETSQKAQEYLTQAQEQEKIASGLEAALKEGRGREEVKEQLRAEQKAVLDEVIRVSNETDPKTGKPTERALRARRAAREEGSLDLGGATLTVEVVQNSKGEEGLRVTGFNADPLVYDGTNEDVLRASRDALTDSKGGTGIFDLANKAIREKKEAEKVKKQEERDRKAGNKVIARLKL